MDSQIWDGPWARDASGQSMGVALGFRVHFDHRSSPGRANRWRTKTACCGWFSTVRFKTISIGGGDSKGQDTVLQPRDGESILISTRIRHGLLFHQLTMFARSAIWGPRGENRLVLGSGPDRTKALFYSFKTGVWFSQASVKNVCDGAGRYGVRN